MTHVWEASAIPCYYVFEVIFIYIADDWLKKVCHACNIQKSLILKFNWIMNNLYFYKNVSSHIFLRHLVLLPINNCCVILQIRNAKIHEGRQRDNLLRSERTSINYNRTSTMGDHVRCVSSAFFSRVCENAFSSSSCEYNRANTRWWGRSCCSPPWLSFVCEWTNDDHVDDDHVDDDFELNKPCCDSVQATNGDR